MRCHWQYPEIDLIRYRYFFRSLRNICRNETALLLICEVMPKVHLLGIYELHGKYLLQEFSLSAKPLIFKLSIVNVFLYSVLNTFYSLLVTPL